MQHSEREITLEVKSRPLRLVYLVRNREDLINAVTLYTHVWGGAANAILPIPENDTETNAFKEALESINPDYIFYSTEELFPDIVKILPDIVTILDESPAWVYPINTEELQNHIKGEQILNLSKERELAGGQNGLECLYYKECSNLW